MRFSRPLAKSTTEIGGRQTSLDEDARETIPVGYIAVEPRPHESLHGVARKAKGVQDIFYRHIPRILAPISIGRWRPAEPPIIVPRLSSISSGGTAMLPDQKSEPFVTLYYKQQNYMGLAGSLKQARFGTAEEAISRAQEMVRAGVAIPLEIRDPDNKLITSARMGWRLPVLPSRYANPPSMAVRHRRPQMLG